MVDFAEFGWFPRLLPSEMAQGLAAFDGEEDDGEKSGEGSEED